MAKFDDYAASARETREREVTEILDLGDEQQIRQQLADFPVRSKTGTSITLTLGIEAGESDWIDIICGPGGGEYALEIRRATYCYTKWETRKDVPLFPGDALWELAEEHLRTQHNLTDMVISARKSVAEGKPLPASEVALLLERLDLLEQRNGELRDNLKEYWDA